MRRYVAISVVVLWQNIFFAASFCQVPLGRRKLSHLDLFGGIFGSDDSKRSDEELALYPNLQADQFDGLSEYIQQWAALFKGGGLTTPVKIIQTNADDSSKGVQILFQKVDTGYQDKDSSEESEGNEKEKERTKAVSEGGVEVLVEKKDDKIQVRARRCEIEEGTMIKEMSEDAILQELKKAMEVWRKETKAS